MIRTLLINLGILALLLLALIVLPPLAVDGYRMASRALSRAEDPRAALPNYQDFPWARQHFKEFAKVSTTYFDFIGWRRNPFEGETLHIDAEGFRTHPGAPPRAQAKVWVLGGSTVWGPGVSDAFTIPARIQALTGQPSFNLGESAYTAHQSLNLLMKSYVQGGRPDWVVSYDGANEVVIKCRAELSFFSAAQEPTLRQRVNSNYLSSLLLAPSLELLTQGTRNATAAAQHDGGYDCDKNPGKRQQIAANLVLDWQVAKQLVESHGGHFLPVLQPVAFTGSPRLDHLPQVQASLALKAQYDAVYAEIRRQLSEAGLAYLDLTQAFDGSAYLYIDFAHVSPQGNEIVARAIQARMVSSH